MRRSSGTRSGTAASAERASWRLYRIHGGGPPPRCACARSRRRANGWRRCPSRVRAIDVIVRFMTSVAAHKTAAAYLEAYLRELTALGNRSPHTIRNYRNDIGHFLGYCEQQPLE